MSAIESRERTFVTVCRDASALVDRVESNSYVLKAAPAEADEDISVHDCDYTVGVTKPDRCIDS